MNFEIIDGNLKIAACKIGDLAAELAESILKQWEPGATLQDLTVFKLINSEQLTGWVIINKESQYYDLLLVLTKGFLRPDKDREFLKENIPDRLKETVDWLRKEADRREAEELIKQAGYMPIGGKGFRACEMLIDEYLRGSGYDPALLMVKAFACGIIQGKRMDRAKRKNRKLAQK